MKLMGLLPTSKRRSKSEWRGVCPTNAPSEIDSAYHNGDLGPKNSKKVAKRYYIASELESAEALFNIGTMHRFGYGVKEINKAVAAQYFQKAAEKGHIEAQYWIGYMFQTGEGLPQNCERAIEWFKKAADKGDEPARKWLIALEVDFTP